MTIRHVRAHVTIAALLALVMITLAALPTNALEPRRRAGAEQTAIRLVNCMRTGGLVTAEGKCKGWGSGRYSKFIPPLRYSDRVSDRVSWPWAQRSAQFTGPRSCWIGHAHNGSTVDTRFASASLNDLANGENMGCGYYGTSPSTVVRIVRMWQAEKAYRGIHWRQIKNPRFKSVGAGVAKFGNSKSQLVLNFYGKLVN